ncbi:hypothetical protein R6Q57_011143 [Mikania cordata]
MTEISPTFLGELIQAIENVESKHKKDVKADLEVKVDEDDDKIGDLIANLEFLSSNEADCQQTNKKSNEEKEIEDEILFIRVEKPKNQVDRQKRIIKLSDALRSPYRQRIVQLNVERGENNFKARMRLNELLINLETNLESTLLSSIYKSIEDVDILIVPILHDSHYYLICFNFKNETIDVIDNMKGKMKLKQKYRLSRMTQVMLNYLENHFPSLHNKLDGVVPTKLDLPWQTDKNFVDCGVFAMRHMETYKGQPINEWTNYCGLKEEADQYVIGQLNDLRIKYLSKMLLSDVNLLRDKVMSQLEDFEKIDISEREKLKKGAEKRIIKRIQKYC